MKSSPRSFVRVQGKYPHKSWVQHGLAIPPISVLTSPEPLIAPPEPMLPDIELHLWSRLLSLALIAEKMKLLLRAANVDGNRKFPEIRRR
jgi:hypothetical protein